MSELKEALINISEEVRTKIIPENIKAGVQIFDTVGNFLGDALDTSDATATAGDIVKGKTAYVNGEKVTGTLEDRGYNAKLIDTITSNNFSVGSSIREIDFTNVDMSALTHHRQRFTNLSSLVTIKGLKTQNITNMYQMFYGCKSLTNIEYMDVSSLKTCGGMFTECTKLSNESLNIILKMCTDINGEIYTGEKTLATLGLTEEQATVCQGLSNYQVFLDAGWTTGY